MIITITEPMDRTESEVFEFLFHQVALGIPLEQVEVYFEVEDLPKVKEMWNQMEGKWVYLCKTNEGV